MSLKYDTFWAVVGEKTFKYCLWNVSYLCTGILRMKSAFSPVINIF